MWHPMIEAPVQKKVPTFNDVIRMKWRVSSEWRVYRVVVYPNESVTSRLPLVVPHTGVIKSKPTWSSASRTGGVT